jgi:DNA-binding protein HU-beta
MRFCALLKISFPGIHGTDFNESTIFKFNKFYGANMNKAELITKIAEKADVSKALAEKLLNATLSSIHAGLTKDDNLTLVGFGTFSVVKRAARKGRNPQTGKTIKIPAKKVVKFKPGKTLKDAVNG